MKPFNTLEVWFVTGSQNLYGEETLWPVAADSQVTLTAAADAGKTFRGWTGACTGSAATCVVTMNASRNVAATFGDSSYPLTVTVTGAGTGATVASRTASQAPRGMAQDTTGPRARTTIARAHSAEGAPARGAAQPGDPCPGPRL